MENKDCKFIDGVHQVHFLGGLVRLDLFRLKPQMEGEPTRQSIEQLVMTPAGFVSVLNTLTQMAYRLTEAGVLQRNQESGTTINKN